MKSDFQISTDNRYIILPLKKRPSEFIDGEKFSEDCFGRFYKRIPNSFLARLYFKNADSFPYIAYCIGFTLPPALIVNIGTTLHWPDFISYFLGISTGIFQMYFLTKID